MTRTPPKRVLPLLIALLGAPAFVQAADEPPAAEDTGASPLEDGETPGSLRRYAVRSGGGCVAGAIAGTIVPGLGNAVGCVIGAVGGWLFTWMQEPEDLLDDDE